MHLLRFTHINYYISCVRIPWTWPKSLFSNVEKKIIIHTQPQNTNWCHCQNVANGVSMSMSILSTHFCLFSFDVKKNWKRSHLIKKLVSFSVPYTYAQREGPRSLDNLINSSVFIMYLFTKYATGGYRMPFAIPFIACAMCNRIFHLQIFLLVLSHTTTLTNVSMSD